MNLITRLFKKNKKQEKIEKKGKSVNLRPFTLPKADLEELYRCSVQKTVNDFKIAKTVINGNTVNVAMDSIKGDDTKGVQNAYQPNILGQEIIFTHFAKESFIGFNNCSILLQNWLIYKCCAKPVEEAVAIDYDITLKDEEVSEEDKTLLNELKDLSCSQKYQINEVCKNFGVIKRGYGQALCIPLVEGVDYSEPFNIDAVAEKSYKGMIVIEPIWVTPILDIEATTNPLSKRYYQPTYFRLPNGQLVHHTWFIFNTYTKLPDILKPTYYFGGIPLPQLLYEKVYCAEKTAQEAPLLTQSKRLNYMEGNLNAYLFDEEKLQKELGLMSWLRNNWGWLFIKKDQRIGQIDTALTDVDSVTMLNYQIVAAVAGVPSAKLLETSPKGWQSNGSFEDDNYRRVQQEIQRNDFLPILNFHNKLLAKSEFGKSFDFACNYHDIDVPTEKERAEINEINSRTDMNYLESGVIAPEEVRSALRENVNSGYTALSEEMEGEPLEIDNTENNLINNL